MTAMEERVCVDCFAAMRRGDRSLPVVAWVNDDPLCAMHAKAAGWTPELPSEMDAVPEGEFWCVVCATEGRGMVAAVVLVDGEARCRRHANSRSKPETPQSNQRAQREHRSAAGVGQDKGRKAERPTACIRGCGRPRHAENCAGMGGRGRRTTAGQARAVTSPKLPATPDAGAAARSAAWLANTLEEHGVGRATQLVETAEEETAMDTLKAEEVAVTEIPTERQSCKQVGRIGELWVRLEGTPPGRAQRVYCRDVEHAGYTARQLREKAMAMGRAIEVQRVSSSVYAYLR